MALTEITNRIIADVGISMGDEGKGRLICEVISELKNLSGNSSPVSMVIKVNGGANSGHTAGGLKLNLLPAAVVDESVPQLGIGSGVVADPRKFLWEAIPLEVQGYDVLSRLLIDERTLVSDLTHRLLDLACENYRVHVLKQEKRGTTGRGITPAYIDEVGQWPIFYLDFLGPKEVFAKKFYERIDRAERTIKFVYKVNEEDWNGFFDTLSKAEIRANAESIKGGVFPEEEFDFQRFKRPEPFKIDRELLLETYWQSGTQLVRNVGEIREIALKALREEKYIIGEFGQSYWLDKRLGFTPNLTASHTFTPEFFQSIGIPLQPVHTFGVCKAYDTKVGTHVFLTSMAENHPLGNRLRQLEFGTSTGRGRMVGWFDAVEKGDALRYGGFNDLMINKLDALSYSGDWDGGELLICVAYRDQAGKLLHHVPRNPALQRTLKPVYIKMPGWQEDLTGIRSFADLPHNAKRYVAKLVQSTFRIAYPNSDAPPTLPNLRYIGIGPDPNQIIKDAPSTEELLSLVD